MSNDGYDKVTPELARAVAKAKGTHIQISLRFNIPPTSVGNIKTGRHWSEATGIVFKPKQRVTPEQHAEILASTESQNKLARRMKLARYTIQRYQRKALPC